MAAAQDMSPAPAGGNPNGASGGDRQSRVDHLYLKSYAAAKGDLSACAGDQDCLEQTDKVKSWLCVSSVCDGTDKSKEPLDCFTGAKNDFSDKTVQQQINSSLCSYMQSPSTMTRKGVLSHLGKGAGEDVLIEFGAYIMAIKSGSSTSCEEYIKDFLGNYGPNWNYRWFKALAGCRILAHERTPAQEEADFSSWFAAVQGSGKCSDILNTDMRNQCYNPGATSAIASYVQL